MIILDTDVLIEVLRRHEPTMRTVEDLSDSGEELATTSINMAEILRGIPTRSRATKAAHRILAGLIEVPFGPRAARRLGRLMFDQDRVGTPLPVIDAMIAAVAMENGARVMTGNVRHFQRVPGLELLDQTE